MSATTSQQFAPRGYTIIEETPLRRRWTREQYYKAYEVGVFEANERLELIAGEVITKMPQGPKHFSTIQNIVDAFASLVDHVTHHIRAQGPITLPNDSEPEPDVAIVMGKRQDYYSQHPTPEKVLLLVEVSETTGAFDQNAKANVYAAAGISEYWVLDLKRRTLIVYRAPSEDGWGEVRRLHTTDNVTPNFAPDAVVAVSTLFPPEEIEVEEAKIETEGA
jgi:Uma2 family endonuclease